LNLDQSAFFLSFYLRSLIAQLLNRKTRSFMHDEDSSAIKASLDLIKNAAFDMPYKRPSSTRSNGSFSKKREWQLWVLWFFGVRSSRNHQVYGGA